MKRVFLLPVLLFCLRSVAQDTTMNNLTQGMETSTDEKQSAVIFNSDKIINANTTETVGRGKMMFKVTHNFDDVGAPRGGLRNFFGLDATTDVRIGFHIGLTDRLDIHLARVKGAGIPEKTRVLRLWELALKYQLARQIENDPSHPLAISLFGNIAVSSMSASFTAPKDGLGNSTDTALNYPFTFTGFGERMSEVLQLILAKKMGRVSALLNFTLVNHAYVALHDQNTMFAIGGGLRLPVTKKFNLLLDYFIPFRSQSSRDYYKTVDNSFNPPNDIDRNKVSMEFYNPLGIGFEILTPGHIFTLNFSNTGEILEQRFIPYTHTSWTKSQFRWCFNIARKFVLKRQKN